MPRARTIKPGFFQNEDLCLLPPLARIFFAGLWCWADRDGRLEDRAIRLKAQILPYDKADPEKLLEVLAESPEQFIIRYTIDGRNYIQITNFHEHQNPHCKEPASTMPAPDKHHTSTVQAPECGRKKGKKESNKERKERKNSPLTMGNLPLEPGASTGHAQAKPEPSHARDAAFDEWWKAYPRKVGKDKARHEYQQAERRLATDRFDATGARDYLLAKVTEFAATPKGKAGQFCPHPATWLHQGRYDDDPATWQQEDRDVKQQVPSIDLPGATP